MPRCGPAPIRRSPRRPSGSAAPRPTSKASCGGWRRPSQPRREPRGGASPLPPIGGMLVLLVLFRLVFIRLAVLGPGEVLDDDAVHQVVPLTRVGLLVRV